MSLSEFKRASNELRSTLEEEVRIEEQREKRAVSETTARVSTAEGTVAGGDEPVSARPVDQGA